MDNLLSKRMITTWPLWKELKHGLKGMSREQSDEIRENLLLGFGLRSQPKVQNNFKQTRKNSKE